MYKFFLLFSILFYKFSLAGECVVKTKVNASFTIPALFIGRDVPIGTVIGTYYSTTASPDVTVIFCEDNSHIFYSMKYDGGIPTGIENVYKTNVDGVGYSLSNGTTTFYYENPPHERPQDDFSGVGFSEPQILRLYKTGPIKSGTLQPGIIGQLEDSSHNPGIVLELAGQTPVTQTLCTLLTPSLVLALPDLPTSNFGSAVGFVPSGTAKQTLELDCDPHANINIALSGTQNPDVTDNTVLALSNQDQPGSVDGVGVQLFYNSEPLAINSQLALKTSDGGHESFLIEAKYYQTKEKIRAGKLIATATLNLTYQ
jgi:type 1 fimbria pilin